MTSTPKLAPDAPANDPAAKPAEQSEPKKEAAPAKADEPNEPKKN